MVAYSFQKRFAEPILAGTKAQTIRAPRKRHARPGEELQLYTGMRTKYCRLIARVPCRMVCGVGLNFADKRVILLGQPGGANAKRTLAELDEFARGDGFKNFDEMAAFWRDEHGVDRFAGVLIRWDATCVRAGVVEA